ncbi:MAG: AMP-binding protein [Porphyromonas sp.]|nr:AMP-binding protein [Porphyromonas sp.]
MSEYRYSIIKALYKQNFISPKGIFYWVESFIKEGLSLMALLHFSSKLYSEKTALIYDNGKEINYKELYEETVRLAKILVQSYGIKRGDRVAVLVRNHPIAVMLLSAFSRIQADIHLLNTDLNASKIEKMLTAEGKRYTLLIADSEILEHTISANLLPFPLVKTEEIEQSIHSYDGNVFSISLPRIWRGGEFSILTGGSSGNYKEVSRKPSATNFLPPLLALFRQIGIQNYSSTYLALPLYHGFGLATLIISMVMGKKVWLTRRFDPEEALYGIEKYRIEVMPVVPLMLSRMLQLPQAEKYLGSLRAIICGGDRLDRKLILRVHATLSPIIFNLYGTSEAGFFLLATPKDLDANSETTIGKPIKGVRCEVRNVSFKGIGELWVSSRWAMQGRKNRWQNTGDRVRTSNGYYFHEGRQDQMVVCGGENVYPEVVERVILEHPKILSVKVYPALTAEGNTFLAADIEPMQGMELSQEELKEWLLPRLSRAEMPRKINIGAITTLATGKRISSSSDA